MGERYADLCSDKAHFATRSVLLMVLINGRFGCSLLPMLTDDLPEKLTGTAPGDMIWLPYTGKSLETMLTKARRMGWDYRTEPHGLGTLLHCTGSPLGQMKETAK